MIKRLFLCLSVMLAASAQANSHQINSATIIKNTLTALPNCLHYKVPMHVCLWVNEFGKVNTTPVLDHYLPDLVVSVFAKPSDNPWFEVNKIIDHAGQPVQQAIIKTVTGFNAGSGSHSLLNQREQMIVFKEADVIGNPAISIIPSHGLLPSAASSWKPYFISMADSVLWRGLPPASLPEEGLALAMNFKHHIGTGITNWGGIYPHEGKVIGDNDVKASAVIAARAADLLTNHQIFGHVYQSLSNQCGKHCRAASIEENSKETYFQMIYPIVQNTCQVLGEDASYRADMINSTGSYVWVIWRHYQGCADGDGQYIGRT